MMITIKIYSVKNIYIQLKKKYIYIHTLSLQYASKCAMDFEYGV